MSKVRVTDTQFEAAVQRLAAMDEFELEQLSRLLKARKARGYYVALPQKRLSLKLVIKAAYSASEKKWNNLQSREVFDRFKHLQAEFSLIHEPEPRKLKKTELENEESLEREYVNRLKRKGQAAFRRSLLEENPVCHLTGCTATKALEAAHIQPASEKGKATVGNGILLRADLHRLFDLGFLAIEPSTGRLWLHSSCQKDYACIAKFKLDKNCRGLWKSALQTRWEARRK
jgi:hypothetical protein